MLIEGYASLFGVEDQVGDVVRAGAFARSLARGGVVPMLLQHRGGQVAGSWTTIREDGRGLFVRGIVRDKSAAGKAAVRLIAGRGLDGLSIGFVARDWSPRVERGRLLKVLELREVSLVVDPMLLPARFEVVAKGGTGQTQDRDRDFGCVCA